MEKAERSRTSAKIWLARASEGLARLVESVTDAENVQRPSIAEVEEALDNFDKRLSAWDNTQEAVERVITMARLEDDINAAAEYREGCRAHRLAAVAVLVQAPEQVTGPGSSSSRADSTDREFQARLPTLALPRFSGSITDWQSFWDKFEAIVHHSNIADVTKFTYLQSLLEGEAKAVIAGLSTTSANYKIACVLLEERFGRKEQVVFAHIQGLLHLNVPNQQPVKVSFLRKMQDELLTHVRSLETLGVSGKDYGIFLTPIILSRLPEEIRMEWARDSDGHEGDFTWLMDFLSKEINRRERSETYFQEPGLPERRSKPRPAFEGANRQPTAAALQTTSQTLSCSICKRNHTTEHCFELTKQNREQRLKKVQEAGLCFRCFSEGHFARGCHARCKMCNGSHHYVLCNRGEEASKPRGNDVKPQGVHNVNQVSHVGVAASSACSKTTVLQTCSVVVRGEGGLVQATLLFDSGADRSYVSSSLVKKVKPTVMGTEQVTYAAFGGGKSTSQSRHVYQLCLSGGQAVDKELVAIEVPVISSPMFRAKMPQDLLQKLRSFPLADKYEVSRNVTVDILVGQDQFWNFFKQGFFRLDEGIVAQETVFGWVVSGSFGNSAGLGTGSQTNHQLLCFDDISEATMRSFWDLESIGIKAGDEVLDLHPLLEQFRETVKFVEGRYEVALPWKNSFVQGKTTLVDNMKGAQSRLLSLNRKLKLDSTLKESYDKVFSDMEESKIIEEVPVAELTNTTNPVFYLPHRPIVKEDSTTTKVRPVFDASAAGYNGVSLNDCLEAGPSLIPSLVEVLVRFRRWKVALTADISRAFLQLRLRREDQDVHRFLWDVNGRTRVMRFQRVTFGIKSSPFLLNAAIRCHLQDMDNSHVVEELRQNLYVDDWLSGCDSELEASAMFAEARAVMLKAGMSLAKWNSNSKIVCEGFQDGECLASIGSGHTKILGVEWFSEEDSFGFGGVSVLGFRGVIVTKRVVLSFLARLFDPLGFLVPFIMTAKIMFQNLWQLGLQWDEEVPPDIEQEFSGWLDGLELLKQFKIPRSYSGGAWKDKAVVELLAFGDASPKAYGACVYLRVIQSNGEDSVSLVMSKGKVAPLKRVTLPRLELLGSLLAARLITFVRGALQLPENTLYRCWTDSKIALFWIKGDPNRWKPFVANRVSEIQELTDPAHWFHCPGKVNPADLVTRGLSAHDLLSSDLWLSGPVSVIKEDLVFDVQDQVDPMEGVFEERVSLVSVVVSPQPVLNLENWGSFRKALGVLGWIYRFFSNARSKKEDRKTGLLSYEEVSVAKLKLFSYVQEQAYPAELSVLRSGQSVPKTSSIFKLTPFLGEDNLLRVKGRLEYSGLAYEEKHPVIFPKSHVAKLLVGFQHVLMKHAGVATLITALRNCYWIVGVRRLAKEIVRSCVSCRRQDAQACNAPGAPLPSLRITKSPPFSITGVDYAGPLFCCDFPGKKFYILLFTCAVIRAVHLELVESLSLEDFLLALRRFSSRRGLPSVIYSDNAKTFQGAQVALQKYFGHLSPRWQFIAPRSPWWGGWWERLVRSVKSSLKKSLGRRSLRRVELETTLHEVEACINSRPLTFVGDEIESLSPLTPSHFLIGRVAGFNPQLSADEELEVSSTSLSSREIHRRDELEKFWSVWSTEYLRNLPLAVRGFQAKGNIREGSVVLVREDNCPRLQWPLGVVTKVFPGKDGIVRSVELRTVKGHYTRSVQRLHDLEIAETKGQLPEVENQVIEPILDQGNQSEAHTSVTRSGRISKPRVKLDL